MRWQRRGRSRNLEDRRGQRSGRRIAFGRGLPAGRGGRIGIGGIVLILAASYFLGIDPMLLLGGGTAAGPTQVGLDPNRPMGGAGTSEPLRTTPQEDELVDFVSFVLDDLQGTWANLLPGYRDAKLVLFRDATQSACGLGQSQMGPFYCPADGKVYVDLSFYRELRDRFGAPGDFAQAYVLAHEIGHHVQNLTQVEATVREKQRAMPQQRNALSVRMELQADCLAGVWAHQTAKRGTLEAGDVEEGLRAAAAIGDDRIQSASGRGVQPESFTHGSSAQRQKWLRRGIDSGDPNSCNTFATG